MTTAHVEIRDHAAERVDLAISGEIDLSNSAVVRDRLFASISNRVTAVRIDLSGLDYIDSAGLRILFALADRLRLLQTSCELMVPPGSPTQKVIQLSGLDTLVTLTT
ncbi:anti-anti-sigma factor [Prauserella marina]|uniref:Stage II sporulation protein AA (Anti-sigma F factor antagonist) n=1 Tax=Prauserella marina TaxID=530584 RepID=A0A222VXA9_9PSEU|nr:STAS domain-containing protein [Prauserella marina]ASR38313.1 anti-anti-sigma factor [Prauserella marina]PWV78477.1 stage II sporulation protein AA (anti-sigma F factor antagonist) [Prauserella marina]SDC86914.1 stage II sporulation protein AA (anti-sigma F factor antagonist) [Prauserella marina]